MAADMSVFDMLLNRHEPSSTLNIKSEADSRLDLLDMSMNKDEVDWPELDFLNNMDLLHEEPLMDTFEGMLGEEDLCADGDLSGVSSAASDSGLSSLDQQLSPVPPGLSPLPLSDGSDSDSSSTLGAGDLEEQEDQPVVSTKVANAVPSNKRVRRFIRMTPLTNPADSNSVKSHSLLLPVSTLKGGQGVRTIRIISATPGARLPGGLRVVCAKPPSVAQPVQGSALSSTTSEPSTGPPSDTGSDSDSPHQYPRLDLSPEEKRLFKKEGISMPTHYPLTKLEERELKRIRRKIRNKISAQDSRKRKKEYVDGLEDRVRRCTDENSSLHKRVKTLQAQNSQLGAQVRRLQTLLAQGTSGRQVQNSTCVMVLLLSLALVMVPNLRPGHNSSSSTAVEEPGTQPDFTAPAADKMPPVAGRSRTLLYKYPVCNEELPFSVDGEEEELCSLHDEYEPPSKVARLEQPLQPLDTLEVDDVWPPPKAPPDMPSTLEAHWPLQAHLAARVDALVDEARINMTAEHPDTTRTVLLSVAKE